MGSEPLEVSVEILPYVENSDLTRVNVDYPGNLDIVSDAVKSLHPSVSKSTAIEHLLQLTEV
jgi:hypothetical protein